MSALHRVYLRPTAFVDAPFGHDGQVLRLAGGLCWFAAVELIVAEGGKRVRSEMVAIDRLDSAIEVLPPPLGHQARAILARLTARREPLALGERVVRLDQPQVVGILNVTPDSFSDGGAHRGDPDVAAAAGLAMAAAGAAIIDIGGESTRPGAAALWEGDEIARVAPVIGRLAPGGVALSIDTRKTAVMEAALSRGARLVNDVSALSFDPGAVGVVARFGCPVVLMHHRGTPETMQEEAKYDDVLLDVYDWLDQRVDAVVASGVARDKIIVDPGIGFAKALRDNLAVLNGLALLHGLGCPIMLGASRKRTIGALANEAAADRRLGGSIALATLAAGQGVQLLRVHDVAETVQALKVWRGLRDAALTPPGNLA